MKALASVVFFAWPLPSVEQVHSSSFPSPFLRVKTRKTALPVGKPRHARDWKGNPPG